MKNEIPKFRILCIGETWLGSDARAAFAGLRRLGQSTYVLDEAHFVPTEWEGTGARILRKLFRSTMVGELTNRAEKLIKLLHPHAIFVFKGNYVSAELLRLAKANGALTVNYYPDVSFLSHGAQLPQALPLYDHVFNTKTFGVGDMLAYGVPAVSFLPPGFDPDVHRPMQLSGDDVIRFGCDVAFIGTWSPKKEAILAALREGLPGVSIRIWGNQWNKATAPNLQPAIMNMGITGDDYSRAICASRICLGLLSEARLGASSGDLITARTFQVPACGAFMLHERNAEVIDYFSEGTEAEFFSANGELVAKVSRYLGDDLARNRIAEGGRRRSIDSGYAIDERMRTVCEWIAENQ